MPFKDNKITAPVSVSDVQAALQTNDTSIVRLCSNEAINIWSLRKPVIHNTLGGITDEQLKEANFGFAFHSNTSGAGYTTPLALYQALQDGTAWEYMPPDGTRTEVNGVIGGQPCRLGDFRGYNHAATPFIVGPGNVMFNPARDSYDFFGTYTISPDPDLSWTDMAIVQGKYPCVIVINTTDNVVRGYKTAAIPYGEVGSHVVNVSNDELTLSTNKSYKYVMCLCSAKKTSFDATATSARFYPIPASPELYGNTGYSSIIDFLEFEIDGVLGNTAIQANTSYTFENPQDYTFSTVTGSAHYLGVGTSGRLAILIKITNTSDTAVKTTYINMHSMPTLSSGSEQSERPTIYNIGLHAEGSRTARTGSQISQVEIGANKSIYLVMYMPTLLAKPTGSVSASAQKFITLSLEWNDSNAKQNVSNGSFNVKGGAST